MATKRSLPEDKYILRLYVTQTTPRSAIAFRNLKSLCEEHLAGRYSLKVIDLLKNPELAKADGILAVPTLIRKMPTPLRKFIGTLADADSVLIDFDLQPTSVLAEKAAKHVR